MHKIAILKNVKARFLQMRRVISKTSVRAIIFQNHPPTSIFNFISKCLQGQCIGPVRIRPPQFRIPHHDTGARVWTHSSTYHQKCCICDIDGGFLMVAGAYDIVTRMHPDGPSACERPGIWSHDLALTQDINNESNPILTNSRFITQKAWYFWKIVTMREISAYLSK